MPRRASKEELPEAVKQTLESLGKEHEYPLEVHKRNDSYYVSESTWYWDNFRKQKRKASLYLGTITKDGKLEEPKRKKLTTSGIKNLKEYLKEKTISAKKKAQTFFENRQEPEILRILSTDPREGITKVSENLNIPYPCA